MPNWIRATGRAFVRTGLALSPMAYATACASPNIKADPTYCGMPNSMITFLDTAPRPSRRQRREERNAAYLAREAREYACGDWPQALEGWPTHVD